VESIDWCRRREIPMALCTTNDRPTLAYQLQAVGVDVGWCAAASTWESKDPKPDPTALDPTCMAISVPRAHAVDGGDW
jgi:hypothetical protein